MGKGLEVDYDQRDHGTSLEENGETKHLDVCLGMTFYAYLENTLKRVRTSNVSLEHDSNATV